MAWRKKPANVRSLAALQTMLDEHEKKERLRVRVQALARLREASSIQSILLHQEEVMGWTVTGMRGLEALAHVECMVVDCTALLDDAIAYMEEAATEDQAIRRYRGLATDPDLVADATLLRATSDEPIGILGANSGGTSARDLNTHNRSSAIRRLAERMLQAGTGQILEPSPALVHLASKVFDVGSSSPRWIGIPEPRALIANHVDDDDRVVELANRMLEAGTGLR